MEGGRGGRDILAKKGGIEKDKSNGKGKGKMGEEEGKEEVEYWRKREEEKKIRGMWGKGKMREEEAEH